MVKDQFQNDSWISGAVYDDETLRMTVFVGSDSYECQGVPSDIWQQFKSAGSKGKFFNANIKGKFQHEYFE